ncbi:MAG: hypothetical protein IJW03_01500 [Clostridia bacterium]|nr:hypothetical protein [Clostridia bacterium]
MMKNSKFTKALILALSCLLLVGVAFGISAFAETTDGASSVEIEYKNVSYKGAPSLVYYVGTDAPLAENQKVKMLFWNTKNATNIYNEHTADYSKYSESTATIDGTTYYTVLGEGVAPSEVRLTVFAKPALVEVAEDGTETVVALGELLEYSIFDYALEMFNAKVNGESGTAAEDQVEIYKSFLDYAAAIQEKLFTNAYNGVLNQTKLDAVGGWANHYYVVRVNRYLYDSTLHEYVAEGEYVLFSDSKAGTITIDSDMYYEKNGTNYAFKSYRDSDGKTLNVVKDFGTEKITSRSIFSTSYDVDMQSPGVVEYDMYYGVATGHYITFDEGKSITDIGDSKNFWAQYDATTGSCKSTMTESDVTIYYYNHTADSDPVEITKFYADQAAASADMRDYHYAAVNKTDGTLATKKIAAADVSKYDFVDIYTSDKVTADVVKMNSRGYTEVVEAPNSSEEDGRGNAIAFVKHFYTTDDEGNKVTYFTGPVYSNMNNGGFKNEGYVTALGSLAINADGTGASSLTANASINFANNSPATVTNPDVSNVHIMEFDFCLDGDQYGTSLVQILMGGMIKFNLGIEKDTGNVYLFDETSPAKSGTRYDINGNKTSGTHLGGTLGGKTLGKSMSTNTWYNLRIEYIDGADDTATVLIYIDGELASYIRGTTADKSDAKMTSCGLNFATGTRSSYFYMDDLYVATEGSYYVPEVEDTPTVDVTYYDKVYEGTTGDYHGQGVYFDKSAQIDKSHKPANGLLSGRTSIAEEKLSDGTKNFALHMLKSANAGFSASYAADNLGGNLYIFETDVKVIGSDNKTEWMLKLSFQDSGITAPGDSKEFAMVCIMYKDGYWTIANQSTPLNSELKFHLEEWHNLRLEFNPANDELNVWVNNVWVYGKVGYGRSGSGSDSTYAGMSINVRQRPVDSKYTEILFDNIYTTTEYRDYHGQGVNNAQSEHYDTYTAGEGVTVNTDETYGTYISNTLNTITGIPAHNRGHEYIFETDIRWNGAAGFDLIDSSTAKVLDFVMKSGENNVLSINGVTTNAADSDLMLKVGTVTVATLARDYWMNLRIVYTPHEAEKNEEGDDVYKATYKIYINGAEAYSVTVECDPVNTFDRAILTIDGSEEGVTPNIDLDNTYTAAVYVDDHGAGDNYSNADTNKYGDGDLPVTSSTPLKALTSIGSKYTFEADVKWVAGTAKLSLTSLEGEYFTVYIIPDASDAGYAKLSLTENIEDAFFTIYNNVWYNVQIIAEDGIYTVSVSGKERTTKKLALSATCTGATVSVTSGEIDLDNTYVAVENKNFAGNGVNKDNAIPNYTQGVGTSVVFDPNLSETDTNNKYTDAYVTTSKSQIILGKNTSMSDCLVSFVGGKAAGLHIFESDITWGGTDWGVETNIPDTDKAAFFTVTLKDADGNAFFTIYAVGTYYIDTLANTTKFLKLYTSLDDVAADNAFAYVSEGVTFNLRVEYASTGAYTVYVNNTKATEGTGAASASMSGVDVALGNDVYDTNVALKFTYVASK